MKILKTVLIFSIFFVSQVRAQWVQQTVPDDISFLLAIKFANINTGISCGWNQDFTGRILRTTNAGNTWQNIPAPNLSRSFTSCEYLSDNLIYISGARNLSQVNSALSSYSYAVKFRSRREFYRQRIGAIGNPNYKAVLYKSINGGLNWTPQPDFPPAYTFINDMDFINENTGIAAGNMQDSTNSQFNNLLMTTNGGGNWREMITTFWGELRDVQFLNNQFAVATGFKWVDKSVYGLFLKSTNGGLNWNEYEIDDMELSAIHFINSTTGFITGIHHMGEGRIYKTTNQGVNWNIIHTSGSTIIEEINFYGETGVGIANGYVMDAKTFAPFIVRTSNFGQTWINREIENSPEVILTTNFMHDRFNYYTSGGNFFDGKIYHTTNGGSVSIENNSSTNPTGFSLKQNYPNPFNPETMIEYEVANKQNVVVKIYDALGREVATLVNDIKPAGIYRINFNANNYSGGVYYYEMQTGEKREVKKMILLK